MHNTKINGTLSTYIQYPKDPLYNFLLGREYEELKQYASATSFYLRAAEFSIDDLFSYEALLRIAICLETIGNRVYTVKGLLLRAISLLPDRPEAYYLLARLYERNKDWHECYALACIGESRHWVVDKPLLTDVEYFGEYVFTFEKAIASWWVALWGESVYLFRELSKRRDLSQVHNIAVQNNIAFLKDSYKVDIKYDSSLQPELRYKFPGSENISNNYSQAYQDIFVLTMNNGKRGGSFVEIGCEGPYHYSNTVLLEQQFGWSGISIDINPVHTENFSKERSAKVITGDATKLDYDLFLDKNEYDYLQVDCEPAANTLEALKKVDLSKRKFAVITFEHDIYIDKDISIQEKAKKYLESYGYVLISNNISQDAYSPFEDWWVHPDLVDKNIIDKMTLISDTTKRADYYMLNRI
jgi:hypothetical protein